MKFRLQQLYVMSYITTEEVGDYVLGSFQVLTLKVERLKDQRPPADPRIDTFSSINKLERFVISHQEELVTYKVP